MSYQEPTTTSLYGQATQTHEYYSPEVRSAFVARVFRVFGIALLISLLGVWAGFTMYTQFAVPSYVHYIIFGVELVLIFTSGWWYNKLPLGYALFALFAFITGITLVPLLAVALASTAGSVLIMKALGATTATFLAAGLYGWATKRDLSGMGSFLLVGLIGIIIASLINIFVGSNGMDMLLSAATVLVITGFVAYDIQNIKERYTPDMFLLAAIALYLDFFILFKNILMLLLSMNRD